MKIVFDTTPYLYSHGKSPSGRGSWAFGPLWDTPANDSDMIWSPSMLYNEAKNYVAKIAKERGITTLYVQP